MALASSSSNLEMFLLGVVATSCLVAGVFFLKFWRRTHDPFFLAFAAAFLLEAANRTGLLFAAHPNEGSPVYYIIQLVSFLLFLAAILRKNLGAR